VQPGALGDRRQRDVPDAAEFQGERLGSRQQVFRAACLVPGRPGPLLHHLSVTHIGTKVTHGEMRYLRGACYESVFLFTGLPVPVS